MDVGVPRYNYGLYSNDYDDATFASGAIRYGYSNSLTLSGGVEASTDGLSNIGTGFAKNLFGIGVINADIAASQYKDENGYSALLGLEGRISKIFLLTPVTAKYSITILIWHAYLRFDI